jgi:hypothetical protein
VQRGRQGTYPRCKIMKHSSVAIARVLERRTEYSTCGTMARMEKTKGQIYLIRRRQHVPMGCVKRARRNPGQFRGHGCEYGRRRVDETTRYRIQGHGTSLQTCHLGRRTWIDGSYTPVVVFGCAFNQGLIDLARDWFVIVRAGGGGITWFQIAAKKRYVLSGPR